MFKTPILWVTTMVYLFVGNFVNLGSTSDPVVNVIIDIVNVVIFMYVIFPIAAYSIPFICVVCFIKLAYDVFVLVMTLC